MFEFFIGTLLSFIFLFSPRYHDSRIDLDEANFLSVATPYNGKLTIKAYHTLNQSENVVTEPIGELVDEHLGSCKSESNPVKRNKKVLNNNWRTRLNKLPDSVLKTFLKEVRYQHKMQLQLWY